MKKIIILFLVIFGFLVSSCDTKKPLETKEKGFAGIIKQQCEQAGGKWNECGSPCAGTGADFCIEMCQVQCECGIAGFSCPEGFKCRLSGKIADEIGVCMRNQG